MKYKVGDEVRVRKDLEVGKIYYTADHSECDSFVEGMLPFKGRVVHITQADTKYRIEEGGLYYWVDEMFEGLAEPHKIVITSDGETTLARMYDGKKVVKSAEAKCSPSDTFDFMTGAQLAMERLTAEPKSEPAFFEGDIVRVIKEKGRFNHRFDLGTVAKVVVIDDDLEGAVLLLRGAGIEQWLHGSEVEKINF